MEFKKTTLKNGFRIITVPVKDSESFTSMVLVGAGSRLETERTNGISHFLEHMTFKGTEKRPSAFDISSTIDGIGGEMNASTGKEETLFYIKAAKEHFPLAIDVLSDMVLNCRFVPEEVEKEKGVIIEELNLYEDLPMRRVSEYLENILYPNSRLGWDIGGTKEIIRGIKPEDFTDYKNRFYHPENMILLVAGGIAEAEVEKLGEKFFGELSKCNIETKTKDKFEQIEPCLFLKNKKTDQTHIAIGIRSNPLGHPDRYIESVLAAMLGGNMSSRLFIQVREKRGLCYYVQTSAEHFTDNGYLSTNAGIDTNRVEEAIKTILNEYQKVTKDEEVDQAELERAKEFVKGRLVLDMEDSRNLAMAYGSQEILLDRICTIDEMKAEVDKVTKADVLRVAREFFTNNRLNMAVIGPFEEAEKFQKLLSF